METEGEVYTNVRRVRVCMELVIMEGLDWIGLDWIGMVVVGGRAGESQHFCLLGEAMKEKDVIPSNTSYMDGHDIFFFHRLARY